MYKHLVAKSIGQMYAITFGHKIDFCCVKSKEAALALALFAKERRKEDKLYFVHIVSDLHRLYDNK